jgi:hypothetical protein
MIEVGEKNKKAHGFYKEALSLLKESGIEFMLGGGFALRFYTGIYRDSKDLDIFCRPRDYPKILKIFKEKGFKTELTDARWLAKIYKGNMFMDVIFDSSNAICTVDDQWFKNAPVGNFSDIEVSFIPPEELFWCKIYVQNRERFDGADLNHLMLKCGKKMKWKRLFTHMDKHWQLLLSQLLNFQFVYPGDFPDIVPKWLFEELLARAREQYNIPPTRIKICRGPLIDQTQYAVDIKEWDYKISTMKTT